MLNLLVIALLLAFTLTVFAVMLLLPRFTNLRQTVRVDVIEHHASKEGTPTMGGALLAIIVLALALALTALDASLALSLMALLGFAVIGGLDDALKLMRGKGQGLSARQKLLLMIILATALVYWLANIDPSFSKWQLPFLGGEIDLGILGYPAAIFVLIGSSNAVNLTDGLDGLVLMPLVIAFLGFIVLFGASGSLQSITIMLSILTGACLGLLVFNVNPARLFLGDVGSLGLGGVLAMIALLSHKALFLVPMGLIFVVEAFSVIMQVIAFKTTGKRVFKMAPLHHHFELKGWREPTIVSLAWIISMLCVLVTVMVEVPIWQ